MADASKAIEALTESRPPATDRFTYLTIVEKFMSPDILPTLDGILQDAQLTQEIGWDLVDMLVPVRGCEPCLETIARLGNPRETIIKVLEVMEGLQVPDDGDEDDFGAPEEDEDEAADDDDAKGKGPASSPEEANRRFIILLGMLAILHKRIQTKYPSRFLATSLLTVYKTYQPNQEMTASVVNLVHSLSGLSGQPPRPPLPTRSSSIEVANPDQYGDASKNAPDPEADGEGDRTEEADIQRRLLLSFTSCVLESYVNANDMQWSRRLLEFYNPDKIVPGRKTATQAFREDPELANRDTMVGKLVVSKPAPLDTDPMLTHETGTHSRSWHVDVQVSHPRHLQQTGEQTAPAGYRRRRQCRRCRPLDWRHDLPRRILGILVDSFRGRPTATRHAHFPRPQCSPRELSQRRRTDTDSPQPSQY